MKAYLSVAIVFGGVLLLSACASTQKTAYGDAPRQGESLIQQDNRYIGVVEQFAKQRGTRVVWVNPPVKKVPQTVATSQ